MFRRSNPVADTVDKILAETNAADLGRSDILDALRLSELVIDQGPLNTNPIRTASKQLDSYVGWVYAAVQILSADIGAQPYSVWRDRNKDREEAELHPILVRPNNQQSWEDLAELTDVHLDLTGRAYWHLLRGRVGGELVGIEAIPPSWITGPKIESGQLIGWKYLVPGKSETILPREDVIFMKWPHPINPLDGASPVQSFALSFNMDMYSRAYTGELMQHRAVPQGFITSDQELLEEQANTYSERWLKRYGYGRTEQGPAVLGKGASYTSLSLSLRDLAFLELAQLSRDQILAIYRVPASKLGLTDQSNFANSREAANSYAENALMPRLTKQSRAINTWLMPLLYDDGSYFEYESPIRRDVAAIEARSREDLKAGVITVNEHREVLGRDPDPNGDVYYIPLGIRIVEEIEPRDPLAIAPAIPDDEPDDDDPDKDRGRRLAIPERCLDDQGYELSGLQFLAVQDEAERKLKAATRRLFSKESKLIIAELKKNTDGYTTFNPDWDVEKDSLVDDVLNLTRAEWNEDIAKASLDSLEKGFGLLGNEVPAKFLLSWDLYQPTAERWAIANAGKKVKDIQGLTRDEVGKIIAEGVESGKPIADIAKEISEQFNSYKGYRADRIARTETANAVNEGKYSHAKESERQFGVSYLKTWNAVAESDRSRPEHQPGAIAPAQTIARSESFIVNGETMDRPLDPRGSAGNVINCRCTLTMEVVEDE